MVDETQDVKPALTPEEWATVQSGPRDDNDGVWLEDDALVTGDPGNSFSHIAFEGADRKRAAALALYGQPFGLTREDVDDLESWLDVADHERTVDREQPTEAARVVIAKLRALLPPRDG